MRQLAKRILKGGKIDSVKINEPVKALPEMHGRPLAEIKIEPQRFPASDK